jgi:hypothetical protein
VPCTSPPTESSLCRVKEIGKAKKPLRRVCFHCKQTKEREEFRVHQWRNMGIGAICLRCQENDGEGRRHENVGRKRGITVPKLPMPPTERLFEKGEVVQCTSCSAWMQAPEGERVAGLNCAIAECRARIWVRFGHPLDEFDMR